MTSECLCIVGSTCIDEPMSLLGVLSMVPDGYIRGRQCPASGSLFCTFRQEKDFQYNHITACSLHIQTHTLSLFLTESKEPIPITMHFNNALTSMTLGLVALLALPLSTTAVPVDSAEIEARKIDFGCTLSCSIWNGCRVFNIKDLSKCGPGTLFSHGPPIAVLGFPPITDPVVKIQKNPPDASATDSPKTKGDGKLPLTWWLREWL